jgi:hypothetical protein
MYSFKCNMANDIYIAESSNYSNGSFPQNGHFEQAGMSEEKDQCEQQGQPQPMTVAKKQN